jgi:hypothetical protein
VSIGALLEAGVGVTGGWLLTGDGGRSVDRVVAGGDVTAGGVDDDAGGGVPLVDPVSLDDVLFDVSVVGMSAVASESAFAASLQPTPKPIASSAVSERWRAVQALDPSPAVPVDISIARLASSICLKCLRSRRAISLERRWANFPIASSMNP